MKTAIVVVLAFFAVCGLWSETLLTASDTRKVIDTVMEQFGKGDYQSGISILKGVSNLSEENFDAILSAVKAQIANIQNRFGRIIGPDFISQEQLGESLMRIIQLEKYEKFVIVWKFTFYNNGSGWRLTNIDWEDKIADLFQK